MKKCILLDRSWVTRIALEYDKHELIIGALDRFEVIALESGGASALNGALEQKDELRGKIYVLEEKDLPSIEPKEAQALESRMESLAIAASVAATIRNYKAAAGRFGGTDFAIIGYAFRLLMIANLMDAAILTWEPRFGLFCAILQEQGVAFADEARRGVRELLSSPSFFPFEDSELRCQRVIHLLTGFHDPKLDVFSTSVRPIPARTMKQTILFLAANPTNETRLAAC